MLPLRYLLIILISAFSLTLSAQRRVTPVATKPPVTVTKGSGKDDKPRPMDRTNVVERTDLNGNTILVDTLSGLEFVDTTIVVRPPTHVYPQFNGITVGVDLLDPFLRLIGQEDGGVDLWGRLSIYNRYFPTVSVGIGQSDITPDGNNFTFKSPVAPYFRVGAAYNMFYNSDPSYQFLVGMMYGFSAFSYEVTDVTVDEGYWQDPSHFTIPSHRTTAGWLEITFGVKVRIYGSWALGWNFKFHTLLHEGRNPSGNPMYIPGYGKRSNALTAGFSLMYTIPWPVRHSAKASPVTAAEP